MKAGAQARLCSGRALFAALTRGERKGFESQESMEDNAAFEHVHTTLTAAMPSKTVESSELKGTISVHFLKQECSFSEIGKLNDLVESCVSSKKLRSFLSTSKDRLVFSVNLAPTVNAQKSGNKRRREEDETANQEDKIEERVANLRGKAPSSELDVATMILKRVLTDVKGPQGEVSVQAWGLFLKKISKEDEQSVVIAVRFHSGVALSVNTLKRSLGAGWKDGLVTTSDSAPGLGEVDLPYTEEGKAALEFGNRPLLAVTRVAKQTT